MTIGTYDKMRVVVNEEDPYDIGSFSLLPTAGFVGISPSSYFWDNGPGPFSRLHLAEPGANGFESLGYRPWMRNGITLTGNSDQMYIGQKYTYDNPDEPESGELNNYTDAIIQWSDNPGTWLSDRMRFIFTSEYNSMHSTGNGSMEGLEAMQLYPHDSGSEVFVGIGDWFGQSATPDERLDVLDRTIMIRRLVPDYENQELEKFVVTDDDGRLHWRSLANLPDNCEWSMSSTSPNHVITAVGAVNNACPDAVENVRIGMSSPIAKLDVFDDTPASNDIVGLQCIVQGASDECIGAKITTGVSGSSGTYRIGTLSISRNGTDQNYGSRSKAELDVTQSGLFLHNHGQRGESVQTGGATYSTCGLTGEASMTGGSATWNAGVYGRAVLGGSPTVTYNVGVYGIAENAGTDYGVMGEVNDTLDWAGFFKGRVNVTGKGFIPGGLWQNSDAQFKTNVQPMQGGLAALEQVQPRTFEYLTNQFRMFELPTGVQPGVVAQELQQVLPQLVTDVTFPEQRDSLGNVVTAAFDYKAVNYVGFTPYLISAVQELAGITEAQQATISTLQNELSTLQQDLATCCSAQGGTLQREMIPGAGTGASEALRTDLHIIPNPVADLTQLRYTVATPGRTRLEVSDSNGKRLEVLEEAVREVGSYSHAWNTTDLAPGTYHCTLYLNDSFVVKKAAKVAR